MVLFPSFGCSRFLLWHWDLMYRDVSQSYKQFRPDILDISPAQLRRNKNVYITHLCATLLSHNYLPQAVLMREVVIENKCRLIYQLTLSDRLMHCIWVKILNDCLASELLPQCYAYQKGKSYFSAVRACAAFVRQQHKQNKVDLYVLRCDIKKYFDSIPVHQSSSAGEQFCDASGWCSMVRGFF